MSIHEEAPKGPPLLSETLDFTTYYFPHSMKEQIEKAGNWKGKTIVYYRMEVVEVVKY